MDERAWVVVKNGALSGLLKGGSMVMGLAMLPAYLGFFGDQATVGVWLTAVSIVNWLLTLDFGIGNGMRNSLVASLENRDWDSARLEISGAYGAALGILGTVTLPTLLILEFANWQAMVGIGSDPGSRDIQILLLWLFATVAVQFVLRTVTFMLYALQRAAWVNTLAFITSALLLMFVIAAGEISARPNVEWLGPVYMIAVNAPLLVATVALLAGPLLLACPRSLRELLVHAPAAFRTGRVFFVNQVLYTALLGTSTAMVAMIAGAGGVVSYQAHYTLFSISGVLAMLALSPLWSAVTHAVVARDYHWIQQALRRSEFLALALCLLPIGTVFLLNVLLALWLGPGVIESSTVDKIALALFGCGFVLHGVAATFAAGLGKLRLQLAFYAGGFCAEVVTVWVTAPITDQWALVPAVDGFILLAYFFTERRSIRRWLSQRGAIERTSNPGSILTLLSRAYSSDKKEEYS